MKHVPFRNNENKQVICADQTSVKPFHLTWPWQDCHPAKQPQSSHQRTETHSTKRLQLDQQIDQIFHRWSARLAKVGSYLQAKHESWLSVRCIFCDCDTWIFIPACKGKMTKPTCIPSQGSVLGRDKQKNLNLISTWNFSSANCKQSDMKIPVRIKHWLTVLAKSIIYYTFIWIIHSNKDQMYYE